MAEASNKETESGPAPAPGAQKPVAPPQKPAGSKQPSGGRGRVARLVDIVFYLILLGSIGFIGYLVYEQDKAMNVLFDQQNSFASQRNETISRLEDLRAEILSTQGEVTSARQETAELISEQAAAIERLQNELVSTRLRVNSTNAGASQEWLLAEAASLLRLARQHLVVSRDIRTAQALYIAADDVLKQIDDPAIFAVREILAGELASIRAVTTVDVGSLYLQLGAIADQVATLRVTNDLQAQIAAGDPVTLSAGEAQEETGWLRGFFNRVRNTFSNYFVVRRRDLPIQPLLTPGQEAALMQTIRLQLEQGRTALLKGEQEIYTSSLVQARNTIDAYLAGEGNTRDSILSALDDLRSRRIVTEVPPLNQALPALEQILSARDTGAGNGEPAANQ